MHNGQGYYHPYHNTPRPNYSSNHNRQPSPSKGSPTNSLLDRISSTPAGSSPTRPSRTSYPPHPRPPVENPAPTQVASPSQENGQEVAAKDVALPSEETVEAFLASVLTTDVVASRLQAPSTSTSASQSSAPPPSTATQSQPSTSTPPSYAPQPASAQIASPPGLLSSTRALLLPHILANARARDPTGAWDDVRSAEAARRARELVTDEWCEEMIAHARRAREEMRKRGVSQEAEVRMDVDVNAGKSVDVQMADNKGKAAEVENQTSNVGAEEMDMSKQEERLRVVEAHGQPPQPLSQLQPRLRLQPQPQFQPQPQLQPQPHLQVQSHPHPQVQSHPHPPGGTMLDGAARVLQNFIANTPRPPSPMSREATDHSTQTAGPSHTAGPSSSAGPASVVHAKSEAASIEGATTAADNESGLWALRVGSRVSEIATITFDMQDSVAPAVQRWARRHTELDERETCISVHLLCLPALAVAEANSSLGASASPSAMTDALRNIPTQWPPKGALVVDVNGGDAVYAHTFLPAHLDAAGGAVDITPHIRPGANTVRLIQLRDLSEWVFVVHACTPSDDEYAQFAVPGSEAREWAAFVARASGRPSAAASTPVPMAVAPV